MGRSAAFYSAYRRALRLARALPSGGVRGATLSSLRALARDAATDAPALQSRAAALRAVLPRRLWPACERAAGGASAADARAVRVDRRPRAPRPVSRVPGVHADDLARHRALVERMNFRGPVWRR